MTAAHRRCSTGRALRFSLGVLVGFAALIVRALDTGAYSGAAVVGAFFALFVWQSGTYFWRNRPGHYRPDALPTELVPNG